MNHSHHAPRPKSSIKVRRALTIAVAPFVVAVGIGLVVMWPGDPSDIAGPAGADVDRFRATVEQTSTKACGEIAQGGAFRCFDISARLDEGPDEGDTVSFVYASGKGARSIEEGDGILLAKAAEPVQGAPAAASDYYFIDFQRTFPLVVLGLLFAGVVIALSRWRGLAALAGMAISLLVITNFLLPAILEGQSPLFAAIVAAAAIMFPALYLAHGVNVLTTTAVLGTLVALALTGLLSIIFVGATNFTGLASEEATFLQVSADQINLTGLLLGGIIIGTLGVLDDVTITQASAVWELHGANPAMGPRELYRSAVRIGRDHIASTVNTLVLAYVGASLPLMIVFSISNRPVAELLTTEVMAEEIVRTLVGSIGLVASVPVTTGLAAIAAGGVDRQVSSRPRPNDLDPLRPRAEMEWRQDS
ncbi:MAG: YibE/F family protein [Actinomycetota bacterium]